MVRSRSSAGREDYGEKIPTTSDEDTATRSARTCATDCSMTRSASTRSATRSATDGSATMRLAAIGSATIGSDSLILENVITFHNTKGCNGQCNHDAVTLDNLDNWDVDAPESASDPPSEAVLAG
jgi:hypothetical protein